MGGRSARGTKGRAELSIGTSNSPARRAPVAMDTADRRYRRYRSRCLVSTETAAYYGTSDEAPGAAGRAASAASRLLSLETKLPERRDAPRAPPAPIALPGKRSSGSGRDAPPCKK